MPFVAVPFILALVVVAGGCSLAAQQVVNSGLRSAIGSAWWTGFVSYAGGTLFMLIAVILSRDAPPSFSTISRTSPVLWTGGALGGVYIAVSVFLVPRFGVAVVLALFVVGQMLASITFDQFGLFGVAQHSVSVTRVIGALALVGGVLMIKLG